MPSSQAALPSFPKVGDFGTLVTQTSLAGVTIIETWALNADFNGASQLVFSTTTRDGTTVIANETDTFILDSAGVPTKVVISVIPNEISIAPLTTSGAMVTLSGNKN